MDRKRKSQSGSEVAAKKLKTDQSSMTAEERMKAAITPLAHLPYDEQVGNDTEDVIGSFREGKMAHPNATSSRKCSDIFEYRNLCLISSFAAPMCCNNCLISVR